MSHAFRRVQREEQQFILKISTFWISETDGSPDVVLSSLQLLSRIQALL